MSTFKCFKHPQKNVEAICTESFCNHYRFFCITCFLENSQHFINHKNSILEINDVLSNQQSQVYRNNGNSEIDTQLNTLKGQMKEYEHLIKQKKSSYLLIFKEIENKFQELKQRYYQEVDSHIELLLQKQSNHYAYLKKKVDVYKQDYNVNDWRVIRKSNSEQDITLFFENIIKMPASNHNEFKRELRLYSSSFQKNIQELETMNNHKLINICLEEIQETFTEKLQELKDILILPEQDFHQIRKKHKGDQQQYVYKNFVTPQSDLHIHENPMQTSHMHQQNGLPTSANNNVNMNMNRELAWNQHEQVKVNYFHAEERNPFLNNNNAAINHPFNNILNNNNGNNGMVMNNGLLNASGIQQQQVQQLPQQQPQLNGVPIIKSRSKNQKVVNLSDSGIEQESEFDFEGVGTKVKQARFSNLYLQNQNDETNQSDYQMEFDEFQKPISKNAGRGGGIALQHQQQSPVTHTEGITCIIFYDTSFKNKNIVATGSLDTNIKIWHLDASNFELIKTLSGHQYGITYLEKFKKEDTLFLASACQNHEIKIWNPSLNQGELITTLLGHFQGVNSLLYFDSYLISGSKDKTIKIWDLNELKCVETQTQVDTADCMGIYEGAQTSQLISSCGDGFRIYNYKQNGQFQLKSYNSQAHRCGLSYLHVFKSNEVDMATSGKDGLIKLWNIQKGQCVGTLQGHTNLVYKIRWCVEKALLISASMDGKIKIWDLKDQLKEVESNHSYSKESHPMGDFVVLQEHSCVLSVGNGHNFIKIVYV